MEKVNKPLFISAVLFMILFIAAIVLLFVTSVACHNAESQCKDGVLYLDNSGLIEDKYGYPTKVKVSNNCKEDK